MDRSTGRLDEGTIPASSTPEAPSQIGPFVKVQPGTYPVTISLPVGSEWPNSVQVGTSKRHPSSPFPPETGKRTLETGPSYER